MRNLKTSQEGKLRRKPRIALSTGRPNALLCNSLYAPPTFDTDRNLYILCVDFGNCIL